VKALANDLELSSAAEACENNTITSTDAAEKKR
jgi:hypothetical protein